jgi:hypothetical protein
MVIGRQTTADISRFGSRRKARTVNWEAKSLAGFATIDDYEPRQAYDTISRHSFTARRTTHDARDKTQEEVARRRNSGSIRRSGNDGNSSNQASKHLAALQNGGFTFFHGCIAQSQCLCTTFRQTVQTVASQMPSEADYLTCLPWLAPLARLKTTQRHSKTFSNIRCKPRFMLQLTVTRHS